MFNGQMHQALVVVEMLRFTFGGGASIHSSKRCCEIISICAAIPELFSVHHGAHSITTFIINTADFIQARTSFSQGKRKDCLSCKENELAVDIPRPHEQSQLRPVIWDFMSTINSQLFHRRNSFFIHIGDGITSSAKVVDCRSTVNAVNAVMCLNIHIKVLHISIIEHRHIIFLSTNYMH